ncbi:hypothetical protein AKJ08_0164 [Vulgatibacter incomptus]|uniref:PEGA domain-containing protein n=1 Tax=Vulgatibacter incomptus TaxID=1391653 RepID=A0A0K1P8F3_9BACT|nr:hypothetical protein AKJ08_0164 [Vulgatibacter incomptus]
MAVASALPGVGAAEPRILALPIDADGVPARQVAEVQAELDRALAELHGWSRIGLPAPPPCERSDEACLAEAGRAARADRIFAPSLRSLGGALVLAAVSVDPESGSAQRLTQAIAGSPAGAARELVVRAITPERWTGRLEVDAARGSEIWIDGVLHGSSPLEGAITGLVPGPHVLRVVRPGGGEARSYVEVRFGAATRVRVEPRSDDVTLVGVEPAPVAATALSEGPAAVAVDRDGGLPRGWTIAKWALLGGGAAVAAAGTIPAAAAGASLRERDALRDGSGSFPADARARQEELGRRYEARRSAATGLFVAGGAMLVGAGVLFAWEALLPGGERDERRDRAASVALTVSADGAGVVGRF